ncbi:MAG: ATP-binding protein [bacterium]|nr:ATP-binding protein [bacterium]
MYAVDGALLKEKKERYETLFSGVYRLHDILTTGKKQTRKEAALCDIIESVPACYDAVTDVIPSREAFAAYASMSYGLEQLRKEFRIKNEKTNELSDIAQQIPSFSGISKGNFKTVDNIITPHMELLSSLKNKSIDDIAETTEWFYRKTMEKAEYCARSDGLCVEIDGYVASINYFGETSFEDIGGQHEAKEELKGLCFALKNTKLYTKWGTKPAKGVLMHGPPGTGKTLLAKALANEASAKFYHIKVSDVTSKWYGASEKIMQHVFDLAKKDERAIVFFDELDSLAPQRDGSYEASRRIVSTMLENIDGLASVENIMVVGATNQLEAIDYALLRPGRMDRIIEVPLPDNEARDAVFRVHIRKAEEIAGRELFKDITYSSVVEKSDGFSGADIAEITRRTLELKVRIDAQGKKPGPVTTEELLEQIEKYSA